MPVLGTRILPPRIHTTHMGPGPESVPRPRPRNSQTMNSCMYVYEPAWLANLIASFLLEKQNSMFDKTTYHYGIYCDDGIAFFFKDD